MKAYLMPITLYINHFSLKSRLDLLFGTLRSKFVDGQQFQIDHILKFMVSFESCGCAD